MITIWDDGGNVCGNPCPVYIPEENRILVLCNWNNGNDHEKAIISRTSIDTRMVYMTYSDDGGKTWSVPENITQSTKIPEWTWYACGPCHAIRLENAKHRGRIVVPCNHGVFDNGYAAHTIISDDNGRTWRIGCCLDVGNEATAAELKNGSIYMNMRNQDRLDRDLNGKVRFAAYSPDGGETFCAPFRDFALPEPVCHGTVINYRKKGRLTNNILFSNPDSEKNRENMTIKISHDSGKSWKVAVRVKSKKAAYSDLCVFNNGNVGIYFESGVRNPDEKLVFSVYKSDYFKK